MAKEINIAKDIVEKYEAKDVVSFLSKKLRYYNRQGNQEKGDYNTQDPELQIYIEILTELTNKMNGKDINLL